MGRRCQQHRLGLHRGKVHGVFPVEAWPPGGEREDGARSSGHTAQGEAQRPQSRQGGRPQPLLPVLHRAWGLPDEVPVRARRPSRAAQALRHGFHKRGQRDRRQERQADSRTCGRQGWEAVREREPRHDDPRRDVFPVEHTPPAGLLASERGPGEA